MRRKARYVMLGGFLGAGKTTAILKFARWLRLQNRRVGLITNDQGAGLVDTTLLAAERFAVEEISGGCFCCRFQSLAEAARRLNATTQPDVLVAEPVGSCTDLVATVAHPLRQIYGSDFSVAPLNVLVDPIRALRILGLHEGPRFSEKVLYIYDRQLEEADCIVINKSDLLEPALMETLRNRLAAKYPAASVRLISARQETGLEPWFDHLLTDAHPPKTLMEVDYETYADGEALLGWLNAVYILRSPEVWDGNEFLRRLAGGMKQFLQAQNCEIAHLKMILEPGDGLGDLGVVNLVRSDASAELAFALADPIEDGQLTVNLRGEAPPETLRKALEIAMQSSIAFISGVSAQPRHLHCFRPAKPVPTHRMA